MLNESQRKELIEKIAYKNWQIRTKEDEDNPLLGYGSKETDYIMAVKVVDTFEDNVLKKDNIEDYLDLYGDILENYFAKDYLSIYYDVYRNTNR